MKSWDHNYHNAESNSRAFRRYNSRTAVRLRREGTDDVFPASIRDYSKGGIGFISRKPIPDDSLIQITSPVSTESESTPIHSSEVKVVWSRKLPESQATGYEAGCKWISVNCDWCNKTVPFRQLYQTGESVSLCNECMDELESHLRGQLKDCMHNYLLGNIL